jgi:hypothetical protein
MILVEQGSLPGAINECMPQHHFERNHQGIGNHLIHAPVWPAAGSMATYSGIKQLGGMLSFNKQWLSPRSVSRISKHYGCMSMHPPP